MIKHKRWIVGGLAAALLGTCALIVAVTALTFAQISQEGLRFSAFRFDNVSAEVTEEQRFTVDTPATLIVKNDFGDIIVTGGDTDEIVVQMHKVAWGATQADAEAALATVNVVITQSGNTLTVRYQPPSQVVVIGSVRSNTVDFTITVPTQTAVELDTGFGRVAVAKTTGHADVHSDFGEITLADVTGAVTARSSSGKVTAERIRAGNDAIELRSDFGALTLEDAEGGSISLHSSSGKVDLTDVSTGDKVTADTDFGSVTLQHVTAEAYELQSNSGEITVDGAAGPLMAHTDFGSIKVTNAQTVTLDLKTNSGSIEFSGALGAGPHTVKTDFGTIKVSLPKDVKLTVDLKTDFGKVKSDFPITVTGEFSNEHLGGALNGGGESLTVSTNSGDINLEILNP